MPSYRTHSIHSELILPKMDKKININPEAIKLFSIGPDSLILSDPKIFTRQHANNVKDYFMFLLNEIKNNKLYENEEVMSYLYGQLDHYILDLVTHPLIYNMTEYEERKYKFKPHGLIECWMDNYYSQKYDKNQKNYYLKKSIEDNVLRNLIDEVYYQIYNCKHESNKYIQGISRLKIFDEAVRRNSILISHLAIKLLNVGDITYKADLEKLKPFLNLENNEWHHPETGEVLNDSIDDLWNKACEHVLETIEDVNEYIYDGKPLNNYYINNDISYNTGLPCSEGQKNIYAKKLKKR